ncbi:unnamed protein product, partial [Prorocentrum cordatum]
HEDQECFTGGNLPTLLHGDVLERGERGAAPAASLAKDAPEKMGPEIASTTELDGGLIEVITTQKYFPVTTKPMLSIALRQARVDRVTDAPDVAGTQPAAKAKARTKARARAAEAHQALLPEERDKQHNALAAYEVGEVAPLAMISDCHEEGKVKLAAWRNMASAMASLIQ